MKFSYNPDLYSLEDGRVIARFDGVSPFDSSQLKSPQAAGYGPAVQWQFTICTGSDKGKPAKVITSAYPTKKNSCIRMLAAVTRSPVAEGEERDTDAFKGHFYSVNIIDGVISHQFAPQYLGTDPAACKAAFDSIAGPSPASPPVADIPAF